jgi:hypothetical protein
MYKKSKSNTVANIRKAIQDFDFFVLQRYPSLEKERKKERKKEENKPQAKTQHPNSDSVGTAVGSIDNQNPLKIAESLEAI